MTDAYPDDNPKTAFGVAKVPMHLVPPIAVAQMSLAFDNGAVKYGPFNWREKTISSTVYYAAAMRHLQAWFDGEDLAPDSGVHHLAHVMACCAMVLDGGSLGKLNDNRPPKGALPEFLATYVKPSPAPPKCTCVFKHIDEVIEHVTGRHCNKCGGVFNFMDYFWPSEFIDG